MEAARMAMMWLQDADSISSGNSKLLMIFIGIVAVGSLTQAIVVMVMAAGAARTQKRVLAMMDDLSEKVLPVVASAQELLQDSVPKVKVITENLVETSHLVRMQATEIDATLSEVNDLTRKQVARVNGMVSTALTTTGELAATIEHGIRVPIREVLGIVNGLKAGLDVLVGRVKGFGGRG